VEKLALKVSTALWLLSCFCITTNILEENNLNVDHRPVCITVLNNSTHTIICEPWNAIRFSFYDGIFCHGMSDYTYVPFFTGSPTHSVGASIVLLFGGFKFNHTGQAMTSCCLQSNYSSMVILHVGSVVLRPVRVTPCLYGFSYYKMTTIYVCWMY